MSAARSIFPAMIAAAMMGTPVASPAAEQAGPKDHKPYKLVRVGQIPFYVNKTMRRENGYMAVIHSNEMSMSDPALLRASGARAIEVTTGCALDQESLTLTVFRSETFGIYGSRVDADIHC